MLIEQRTKMPAAVWTALPKAAESIQTCMILVRGCRRREARASGAVERPERPEPWGSL